MKLRLMGLALISLFLGGAAIAVGHYESTILRKQERILREHLEAEAKLASVVAKLATLNADALSKTELTEAVNAARKLNLLAKEYAHVTPR